MSEPNYDELDPGIRRMVALIRSLGFETSDSGDGESKLEDPDWDPQCVYPEPHVVITSPVGIDIARELHEVLQTRLTEEGQENLDVQFSWGSRDGRALIVVTGVGDRDLR